MRIGGLGLKLSSTAVDLAGNFASSLMRRESCFSLADISIVKQLSKIVPRCFRKFKLISEGGNMTNPESIIKKLGLQPLPGEGGLYLETYRSSDHINICLHGEAGELNRSVSTAIYYMVTPGSFSALHRIKQDEIYHFYAGEPVDLFIISEAAQHQIVTLGNNVLKGQYPQFVIPAGAWQGVKLKAGSNGWALMGTTVAPGFEFADFELGERDVLAAKYPEIIDLINQYTRP